jgi:hypothetical protein
MAGLKIFGGPDGTPQKKTSTASDVVGRFRSGYVAGEGRSARPVALSEWRVTTGDPEVAEKIADLLTATEDVKEWDAAGEDNLEVFTSSNEVEIILDGTKALRQAMVLYGRKGIVRVSDGETISYPDDQKGQPDPQAGQTLAERKEEARNGTGSEPRIEVFFRLAAEPDLGLFKFQTGSWSMVSDLAYNDTEGEIEDADVDGKGVKATLSLEEVSFTAKNGPRAGQVVSYTKPVLKIVGPVE